MPRSLRPDPPGTWHHVMNRGLARRVAFPDRAHIRFFLACVARAVRRREIEVHVASVLSTHFHLLVRSPEGGLSEALRRISSDYTRFYNRRHPGRDGALFRGRFASRLVDSLAYRSILVRYIEQNAVAAGLASHPGEYPYASASWRRRRRSPPWLATWWADGLLARLRAGAPGLTYESFWCSSPSPAQRDLVRRRIEHPGGRDDPLADLIDAAPARVRAWMERQARQADGQRAGVALAPAPAVRRAVAAHARRLGPWTARGPRGRPRDLWSVLSAGLLRQVAGLTSVEIASALGLGHSRARVLIREHAGRLEDEPYARRAAEVAGECVRAVIDGAARVEEPSGPSPQAGKGGRERERGATLCQTPFS